MKLVLSGFVYSKQKNTKLKMCTFVTYFKYQSDLSLSSLKI